MATPIRTTQRFTLFSDFDGLAYTLTRVCDNADLYFQGSDADTFKAELDDMELTDPKRTTESILAELWHVFNN